MLSKIVLLLLLILGVLSIKLSSAKEILSLDYYNNYFKLIINLGKFVSQDLLYLMNYFKMQILYYDFSNKFGVESNDIL